MALALSTDVGTVEVITAPSTSEDPLDIQNLWPITTDLAHAATRVAKAVRAIAVALAEDTEAATSLLRQQLLEIRARLVWTYSDIRYAIISDTRGLISLTVYTAGATLRNDPSNSGAAGFESMVASILSGCSTNHAFLEETRQAWGEFHASLLHFDSARSRPAQSGVATFLRTLGTFASQPISSHAIPQESPGENPGASVYEDLGIMTQSLERIEVFWRKRDGLFSGSGYTFGREELARFYRSCQQLGDAYLDFLDPFFRNEQDLSNPQPPILRTPRSLSGSMKTQLSWRALIAP